MRLDQLISRIDRLTRNEKFLLANRILSQLKLKGAWPTEEEALMLKMHRKSLKKSRKVHPKVHFKVSKTPTA